MKGHLVFVLLFLWSVNILAQTQTDTTGQNSLLEPISETLPEINIFDDDTPLDLTLTYDITSFVRQKHKSEYLDAELRLHLNGNDSIVKNIRLKARGNFRKGHCAFPPIYLNFKTDPIETSELEGIKKIKLVTHCSLSKAYQKYILREYLAYKLYNVLTDNSFRVKLLNITYIDTGKRKKNYKQQGFLIEPIDLLVKRTNSIEVDGKIILDGKNVISEEADLVALFQYMIANTDWRIKGGHNTKYIKSLTRLTTQVTPVPYDFDYSGFVDTHYSIPQEWTSIEDVRDREYLGYCRDNKEEYIKTIERFNEKKDEIMETINSFPYIDDKEKRSLVRYLERFYDLADDPEDLAHIMRRECRTNF